MKAGMIARSELRNFLSAIAGKLSLLVPVEKEGLVDYRRYEPEFELQLAAQPSRGVKHVVFPQREEMFRFSPYSSEPVDPELASTRSCDRLVVFGVHPCDAAAIELLSLVFLHDCSGLYGDPYYRARLDSAILIGWACNAPAPSCFCRSVGGHPHARAGLDAILVDLGDQLLVEAVTDSGQETMDLFRMSDATDQAMSAAIQLGEQATASMPKDLKLRQPMSRDSKDLFNLSIWEETAERCLNCGICTYLCPTCSCFDILDREERGSSCRFRTWDSCMFSQFTLHATGYNPRPTPAKRLRQRFMHKLKYFPELHNKRLSCVGCGRCVNSCPVNIDIREVAAQMSNRQGGPRD